MKPPDATDARPAGIAWLFPGQGSERPHMGLDLAARCPAAAGLLDEASRHVGLDVPRLLERGGRALDRSEVLQPVLTAVSLGALLALRAAGVAPDVVAGHSLGEVAAWSAAGVLRPADAIALAAERGRAMADAAGACPGGMVALVGVGEAVVTAALARGQAHGMLVVAARNAPDEWVLSGEEAALRALPRGLPGVRLRVAGPWHSPAMQAAAGRLRGFIAHLATGPQAVPLISGEHGDLVVQVDDLPARVSALLVQGLDWVAVLRRLRGVRAIVTCGPGQVLRSLVRRGLGADVPVLGTEGADDLARTLAFLRAGPPGTSLA